MGDDPIAKDAADCASYLAKVRAGRDWARFNHGIDDYLFRHKDVRAIGTLRQALAKAYRVAAPDDVAGHQRIMGQK